MKHLNILFFALGAILTLQSCGGEAHQQPSPIAETIATKSTLTPCDPPTPHSIKLDSALILISQFLNSPKGEIYSANYSIGSYISLRTFTDNLKINFADKINDPNEGMIFYDLLHEGKTLFALRRANICKKGDRQDYSIAEKIDHEITSLSLRKANGKDTASVRNYLDEQKIDPTSLEKVFKPIQGSDARIQNQDLINNTGGYWAHSSYGCYFFNYSDFQALIDSSETEVKGFVILRGLEKDGSKNYDRLILIAVDKDGKLLHNNNKIIERSWPPRGF